MADLTIVAASVIAAAGATKESGVAGATITAGQVVYKETTTSLFKLADSNGASVNIKTPYGVALNGASAGQPIVVATAGAVTIGATVTGGVMYYLSATPGGIAPVADLATGMVASSLGFATSATVLTLKINLSGFTLA